VDEVHNLTLHHEKLSLDSFPEFLLNNELLLAIGEHNFLKILRNFNQ
jgi:hypothetical protein